MVHMSHFGTIIIFKPSATLRITTVKGPRRPLADQNKKQCPGASDELDRRPRSKCWGFAKALPPRSDLERICWKASCNIELFVLLRVPPDGVYP